MENDAPKVLILGEVNSHTRTLIQESGFELIDKIKNKEEIDAIVIRGSFKLDRLLLKSLPNIKAIIVAGVGYDSIDLVEVRKRRIFIANCPFANAIATAEHSMGLLFSAIKKIPKANNEIKKGKWDREGNVTFNIYGKKIGIVGMGKIGNYTANIYHDLGMEVYAYDPFLPGYFFEAARAKKVDTLDELAETVNFISVHVPKNDYTDNLITGKVLSRLQKPSGVINISRGGVVNEQDVIELLRLNMLYFYATDVFMGEPDPNPELLKFDNVIATPHIAANSHEAQIQVAKDTVMQLREVLMEGKKPTYSI